VNDQQAKAICREVEEILRNHGVWYCKSLDYKDGLAFIRLTDISFKIDQQRNDR
jgi:hypothetical protein